MNNPTPEEIKRHAIKFKDYWKEYELHWKQYEKHLPMPEVPKAFKSDDELYEDFVSGKPVSL